MKLGTLLFAAFAVILLVCFAYPTWLMVDRLRIVYLESAEEPLVDTANVLAELVGQALARGPLDVDALYGVSQSVAARDVSARIYDLLKARVDLDVYVTDRRGKVLFDSRGRASLGSDYSQWRDVSRTLAGTYGARVSANPKDRSMPRVLYVAAPIRVGRELAGSLTVIKPTTAVKSFMQAERPRLIALAALGTGLAIVLAFGVSFWVSRQVGRLTAYADRVREGAREPFPDLAPTELRSMGLAFERMRASLAGHAYIEQYVRALTHEIKSPISAIRGAAEILETPGLSEERRAQFLTNVQVETQRIQELVDRMLELSEIEARRALPERAEVRLAPLLRTIVESHGAAAQTRRLAIEVDVDDALCVSGDAFLLHLALSNLVKNAVEFSPDAGRIRVHAELVSAEVALRVEDEGPGIPEFAKERVFERFYSLARPGTGRKSTGLGLNFVSEIAALHGGSVAIENREPTGLCATLRLPVG